jgi:hypothetical protein
VADKAQAQVQSFANRFRAAPPPPALQAQLGPLADLIGTWVEKGLAEVDLEINFSLLHFYGGVELAVKACLLNEDWKLVIDEPGNADWSRFCNGKQRTVGLTVAARRLAILKSKPIDQLAISAFEKLRTHRNQLTRFFHPSLNTAVEKLRVKKELLLAWYYLHRLVQDPCVSIICGANRTNKCSTLSSRSLYAGHF